MTRWTEDQGVGLGAASDDIGNPRSLTIELPAAPPTLTPAAARALLRLLIAIHRSEPIDSQDEPAWGRTA